MLMGGLVLNTAEFTCALEEQKHAQDWSEEKQNPWSLQTVARFSGWGEKKPEEQVLFYRLKYIHDGIVQLSEHHKVDRKAGAAILSGRVTREPGQCIVLLQNEPAKEKHRNQAGIIDSFPWLI